ncbi:hypothetical protein SY28_03305 [Meiothermus taiwanensis]|nr:hypothetical protein SY28_03305 [Meiothermus taiwanensis]KZK14834.1 hypothetical protein A3962_12430 [Meiothermus taiwanensis]
MMLEGLLQQPHLGHAGQVLGFLDGGVGDFLQRHQPVVLVGDDRVAILLRQGCQGVDEQSFSALEDERGQLAAELTLLVLAQAKVHAYSVLDILLALITGVAVLTAFPSTTPHNTPRGQTSLEGL